MVIRRKKFAKIDAAFNIQLSVVCFLRIRKQFELIEEINNTILNTVNLNFTFCLNLFRTCFVILTFDSVSQISK